MSGVLNMGYIQRFMKWFSVRKNNKQEHISFEQQAGLLKETYLKNHKSRVYINKGEDDELVIFGYKRNNWKTGLTWLFYLLTCGFLRLILYWFPHYHLYATHSSCDIKEASRVLIAELYNRKHKQFTVKMLILLTEEYMEAKRVEEESEIAGPTLLKVHYGNGVFRTLDKLLYFKYKKLFYIWDSETETFNKLHGLDLNVQGKVFFSSNGLSKKEEFMRRLIYGKNKILITRRSIITLLFLEVLNPFYIFQVASFILWFLDDYYYYASAIIIISTISCGMSIKETQTSEKNLEAAVHSSDVITVLRPKEDSVDENEEQYYTEVITTDMLVPGDVIEIPSYGCILHCDALLITGNCILNESMLTGESVPVTKTPFPEIPNLVYNSKEHSKHTLFCGTQVIQTRYFGNKKVLAVVIRTGFYTAKGNLIRSIMYPPPINFQFDKDSYRFVILLAGVAFIGFMYTAITKSLRGIPWRDLIIESLDLITIVVPPALPAAMTIGNLAAQTRLRAKNVFCTSPRAINIAGSINCFCFDKTGTLTEEGLDLQCIVPVENKKFNSEVLNVETLPYDTLLYGLASCHSLTIINQQITGDPLDLKMFESTKWVIEDLNVSDNTKFDMIAPTVVKPPRTKDIDLQIGIIREFPFSSSSQRMGVIVRKLGGKHFEFYCKGSPEMILKLVKSETVPNNFSETLEKYTQDGYRVIALAHKELQLSYTKVQRVSRDVIENNMSLLGFIVLENRLKPETTPVIEELNAAAIQLYMVTGDNILTALSVARDCGIIQPGQSVITVNCDSNTPPQLYYTLNNSTKYKVPLNGDISLLSNSASIQSLETVESQTITNTPYPEENIKPRTLYNNYRFAMCGKSWSIIRDHYPELLSRFVTRGCIFARMTPDQKQQLVEELKALGYYVGMCGDGANDCGALRAAHTGISLSEAESSVACPFNSKKQNITCVIDVVKEGRAALVTSFGLFKYMASYSLCQFVSVMILYSIDSNLTDFEYLFIDLFIISFAAFFFGRTEAYSGKLVKEVPLSNLVSVSPLMSLAFQLVLVVIFQVASLLYLRKQSWYIPFNASEKEDKDLVGCVENYTIFSISCFQYIILSIVFSKGKPYRKSIFTNYGMILSCLSLVAFSIYLTLYPCSFLTDLFYLVLPQDLNFRGFLLIFVFVHFVISILIEVLIIDYVFFKKLRFRFHDINKSKRKYLLVEHELQLDNKWPVLTSDFKSAASPLSTIIPNMAEIVYEKDKFDKDHMFNEFYNDGKKMQQSNGHVIYACDENQVDVHVNDVSPIKSCTSNSSSDLYHSFDSSSAPNTPEKYLKINGAIKTDSKRSIDKIVEINGVDIEMNHLDDR